jgi:starch synthase (maltosyl-transferring)
MVVSLDPIHMQSGVLTLDLDALGLSSFRPYAAIDELSGETYRWVGARPYIKLEPWVRVAHILHLPDARPPLIEGAAGPAEAP